MNQSLVMATLPYSQANADAIAAQDALTAAANTLFIDTLDVMIAQKIAQGKFHVVASLNKDVSLKDVADWYIDLGYGVTEPNCPFWQCQPSALFGEYWDAYWSNRWICCCKKPCKIKVSWK